MGSTCDDRSIYDETQTLDSKLSYLEASARFSSSEIISLQEEIEYPSVKPVKILNNYLFGGVIGQGAFGKVKEVIDENTLVRRAVKIVSYHSVKKIPNGIMNLEREIRVMGRLQHKNIVQLIETFRSNEKKKTYIVMEFCFGTVDQLIKSTSSKYLVEPDAHYLFIQLVDGLEYLHSQGIIHNDIKPTNLLLSSDFVLKICDFGVAEELSICKGDDLISSDKGTPPFKAPEAVSGDACEFSGSKIDIFAAGVTLYYMVCGKIPWSSPCQILQLYSKICEEDYILPPDIPLSDEFKKILDAMLKKKSVERASIKTLKEFEWYKLTFCEEYTRFKVKNYDAFYPRSIVKQKLEQLYGEPIRFSYLANKRCSSAADWPVHCTQSEPDISPIKPEPTRKNPRFSCAHPSPLRRNSFLKWFRAVRQF